MSYFTYDVHRVNNNSKINDPIPDSIGGRRIKPPVDVPVIVGYYRDYQYEWIVNNNCYNVRIDTAITSEMAGARYLLLYNTETVSAAGDLWEIKGDGPELWDREQMEQLDYPHQVREAYIVYRIKRCSSNEFMGYTWDIDELKNNLNKQENDYWPFAVSLLDLMKVKISS